MEIKEALESLDKTNDNHWTQGGLPRLETVRLLVGRADLSREELDAAVPGFTRAGIVDPVVEQTPPAETTTSEEKPKSKADAFIDYVASLTPEGLDELIAEGTERLARADRDVAEAQAVREEIRLRLDDLIDAKTTAQGKEDKSSVLVQYLQARQKDYEARADQMQKMKGIDIRALLPQKSKLDQAISSTNIAARRAGN